MTITEDQARAAFNATLAKAKADVVEAWAREQFPLAREQLWQQYHAIERVEETINDEFRDIIRRAAGTE